jgi:hypothetical protein
MAAVVPFSATANQLEQALVVGKQSKPSKVKGKQINTLSSIKLCDFLYLLVSSVISHYNSEYDLGFEQLVNSNKICNYKSLLARYFYDSYAHAWVR